jgi:hypothetical protein
VALLLILASCSGATALLLPGSGQGRYDGSIRTSGGTELGTFTLRVDDTGKAQGSGNFGAHNVDLRGVLSQEGVLTALITESDTQETGEFDGALAAAALSGTWRFKPDGTTVQTGQWAAVLTP